MPGAAHDKASDLFTSYRAELLNNEALYLPSLIFALVDCKECGRLSSATTGLCGHALLLPELQVFVIQLSCFTP